MSSFLRELPPQPKPPLTILVSECLTGSEVRHDGGHKRSSMPHALLAELFEYRTVCPEVGIGLGVPREPIRLVGEVDAPRAVGVRDPSMDVTDSLAEFATSQTPLLDAIDGCVFMKGSPSCGLFRVKVYRKADAPADTAGRGIFAATVARLKPNLPLEESGRLFDPVLRENFVTRVCVHRHWHALLTAGLTAKRLIAFHSAYKYLVMAHSVPAYRELGRLLSDLSSDVERIGAEYFSGLMLALGKPASRGGHANVLSHLQGYVKNDLSSAARQELAALIESYRRGQVPLLAPLSLLKHHLGESEATYAWHQLYLQPHPPESGLRRDL